MNNDDIVLLIQSMLAPGIMISACGLLVLGMNNKYSIVANRVRLLNEECRRLKAAETGQDRIDSINGQLKKFKIRVLLVRNAVLCYSIAVAMFILASLLIGLQLSGQLSSKSIISLVFFLAGMISVLLGVIFAALEAWRGYRILAIEIQNNE